MSETETALDETTASCLESTRAETHSNITVQDSNVSYETSLFVNTSYSTNAFVMLGLKIKENTVLKLNLMHLASEVES